MAFSNRLPDLSARLRAADLMPPVKSVETAGGGVVRVIVAGTLDPEARVRLTTVMGSARWQLIEAADDHAAGVDFG